MNRKLGIAVAIAVLISVPIGITIVAYKQEGQAPRRESHTIGGTTSVQIVYLNDGTPCAVARSAGAVSITCSWRVPK